MKPWHDKPTGILDQLAYYIGVGDHVVHELHYPGNGSNMYNATREVHGWLKNGYMPGGDLINRHGVDTTQPTLPKPKLTPLYYGPDTA